VGGYDLNPSKGILLEVNEVFRQERRIELALLKK